jgi:hypothetical protein
MNIKKSKGWFLIVGIVFLLFSCNNTKDNAQQIEEAIKFATDYSNTNSKKGWNDEYWDHLCNFNSNNEYNSNARLARLPESYYTGDDAWYWPSDSLRLEYCTMRNNLK